MPAGQPEYPPLAAPAKPGTPARPHPPPGLTAPGRGALGPPPPPRGRAGSGDGRWEWGGEPSPAPQSPAEPGAARAEPRPRIQPPPSSPDRRQRAEAPPPPKVPPPPQVSPPPPLPSLRPSPCRSPSPPATHRMVVWGETAGTLSTIRCMQRTVVRKQRQRLGHHTLPRCGGGGGGGCAEAGGASPPLRSNSRSRRQRPGAAAASRRAMLQGAGQEGEGLRQVRVAPAPLPGRGCRSGRRRGDPVPPARAGGGDGGGPAPAGGGMGGRAPGFRAALRNAPRGSAVQRAAAPSRGQRGSAAPPRSLPVPQFPVPRLSPREGGGEGNPRAGCGVRGSCVHPGREEEEGKMKGSEGSGKGKRKGKEGKRDRKQREEGKKKNRREREAASSANYVPFQPWSERLTYYTTLGLPHLLLLQLLLPNRENLLDLPRIHSADVFW